MTARQQKALSTFANFEGKATEQFIARETFEGWTFETLLLVEPPLKPDAQDARLHSPHWYACAAHLHDGRPLVVSSWQTLASFSAKRLIHSLLQTVGDPTGHTRRDWEQMNTWLVLRRPLTPAELAAWLKIAPAGAYEAGGKS